MKRIRPPKSAKIPKGKPSKQTPPKHDWRPWDTAELLFLKQEWETKRLTLKQIAELEGVSVNQVRRIVRAKGVKPPR
jgi:transposase